jgi:hypothetical protein
MQVIFATETIKMTLKEKAERKLGGFHNLPHEHEMDMSSLCRA